jgi:Fe2+ or Zn2+ uptake regulation protein
VSQDLRNAILKFLEQHDRSELSNQYVDDTTLGDAIGAPVEDVRRQMDILESQNYIRTANTMDSQSAQITPQGLILIEQQNL